MSMAYRQISRNFGIGYRMKDVAVEWPDLKWVNKLIILFFTIQRLIESLAVPSDFCMLICDVGNVEKAKERTEIKPSRVVKW